MSLHLASGLDFQSRSARAAKERDYRPRVAVSHAGPRDAFGYPAGVASGTLDRCAVLDCGSTRQPGVAVGRCGLSSLR